jgi:hypothetical protein
VPLGEVPGPRDDRTVGERRLFGQFVAERYAHSTVAGRIRDDGLFERGLAGVIPRPMVTVVTAARVHAPYTD